jgi:mono/diheme cytochrome c family protein
MLKKISNQKEKMMLKVLGMCMLVLCISPACNNNTSGKQLKGEETVSVANAAQHMNLKNGELIYQRHCQVCHQANGQGVPGYYPPIIGTKSSSGDKGYLIKVLMYGLSGEVTIEGKKYNSVMSNFRMLSDKEIADVLNYVRSQSDDNLEPVSPEEVKQIR